MFSNVNLSGAFFRVCRNNLPGLKIDYGKFICFSFVIEKQSTQNTELIDRKESTNLSVIIGSFLVLSDNIC